MKESDWRAWLESLPSSRPHLHQIKAELERQVTDTETRLRAATWQGNRAEDRALRIELNDLNSKLLLIHSRVKALDLPVAPDKTKSVV